MMGSFLTAMFVIFVIWFAMGCVYLMDRQASLALPFSRGVVLFFVVGGPLMLCVVAFAGLLSIAILCIKLPYRFLSYLANKL